MEIRNWNIGVVMASGDTLNEAIDSIRNKDGKARLRCADLESADLSDAYLSEADLRDASLRSANLRFADLRDADLRNADLRCADLSFASLNDADLRDADLRNADLRCADLSFASLNDADLRDADLDFASLNSANLRNADLRNADLRNTDLRNTDLRNTDDETKIDELDAARLSILPEGELIGYKKVWTRNVVGGYQVNPAIVRLRIPADAKRSNATGRKCRCDKAEVLSITTPTGEPFKERVYSSQDSRFEYKVGATVSVSDFDENRWAECAPGIHFFITRIEAVDY